VRLLEFRGRQALAMVGMENVIVTLNGRIVPITGVTYFAGRKMIDSIRDDLAPGAEVYADYASFLRNEPLRSH
jgi:rRNA processing protein Gar1